MPKGGFRPDGIHRPIHRKLGEVLGGLGISTAGNTAGTTGTVFGPAVLVGVGGITLSQSTRGNLATISVSAASETGIGLAAGTQTATGGVVLLADSNGISFGMSASTRVTATVIPTLAFRIQDATGTPSWTNTDGQILFRNAFGGVQFSASTTGGSVVISGNAISTVSFMVNNGYDRGVFVGGISVGTLHLCPFRADNAISATRLDMIWDVQNVTNAGATITQRLGLYTISGSTIGTVSTASRTWAYNSTAASSSFTEISATRYRSMTLAAGTWNVTPGDYILAAVFNISTSVSSGTHRVLGGRDVSIVAPEYPLGLGSAVPYWNGGFYSATTTALPATIQLSQMVITGADDIIWVPFVTLVGSF